MNETNLARVEAFFRENFERRGELGASLSIWKDGREIVSLADGFADRDESRPWSAETPVLVWSATKGPAAACVLHALERNGERLDALVADFWPEFAQHGKETLTVSDLLSHQGAVAALDRPAEVLDHADVVAALEEQVPNWPLNGQHGYHPRTFGYLLDELVRRMEGMTLSDYWQRWFAGPLGIDFHIGLPADRVKEAADVYPSRNPPANPEDQLFFKAMGRADSLTARAFTSPKKGVHGVTIMNTPAVRMAQLPGFGGIGTARALAKFYQMLAQGGELEGVRYFGNISPMTTTLVNGDDPVLLRPTAFAAGFMRDPVDAAGRKLRSIFGPSLQAFGQPGAGGCHAFADPENGVSFAYVMNQMESGVMPAEKALGLIRAFYGA